MNYRSTAFEVKPLLMCSKMKEILDMDVDTAFNYLKDKGQQVTINGGAKRKP